MVSGLLQPIKILMITFTVSSISACSNQNEIFSTPASTLATGDSIYNQSSSNETNKNINISFLDKDASIKLLATEDEYIQALSPFDWQAKFKSGRKLSPKELEGYYSKAAINWDTESKEKVLTAVKLLQDKVSKLNINAPKDIKFALTNGLVESGAAYTREDYIVLTPELLEDPQSEINALVAHEFFHVYSRYNQAHRDKLYSTVNFKKIAPLVLPNEIDALRITNPDSPKMGYAIDLDYQGQQLTFLPLLKAFSEYDMASNLSFFAYLQDGLLAVQSDKGITRPLLIENKPLFIPKTETNYDAVVLPNSEYLNHPEEVLASNFALWVTDAAIEHEAPVEKLIMVMKSI